MAKVKETAARQTRTKAAAKPAKSHEGQGRFVWHELATTDPKAAETYYKKVIGWGTKPFEDADPSEPYTMWTTGERARGGLMELPEKASAQGAPAHWLTYIGVADTDATVERAQALGARLQHGPMTIPNVGRFAVLTDPQGVAFGVITAPSDGR